LAIPEELIKFQLPEVKEAEIVLIKLEDGTIVARTVEELKRMGLYEQTNK
jgi:hypothetical protein